MARLKLIRLSDAETKRITEKVLFAEGKCGNCSGNIYFGICQNCGTHHTPKIKLKLKTPEYPNAA